MKKIFTILVAALLLIACSSSPANETLKAGTYTGVGTGFIGDITVEVTIDDQGAIEKVEVVEHNESVDDIPAVVTALEEVPARIVENNSADVDGTSGATGTSNGIMAAVKDALEKAK